MLRMSFALLCLAASSGAAAQTNWQAAPRVDVTLANFKFTPATIHLHAGQPVVLHLVNTAGGGHDFSAPKFFASANVRPQDRAAIDQGSVEVGSHQSRDIALVPTAGHYKLKCSHTMHKMFGMSGEIVVD